MAKRKRYETIWRILAVIMLLSLIISPLLIFISILIGGDASDVYGY